MLKKETINLLNSCDANFKNIFSVCIGKSYLYQSRFIDYIGEYKKWDTYLREGLLKIDNKDFNVEYIGTTSVTDNFWYSADLESVIPSEYSMLIVNTRNIMNH